MLMSLLYSKKVSRDLKKTIDWLVFDQLFQTFYKSLKFFCFFLIISKQVTIFIDPLLSKYQFGFQRGFRAQRCLWPILEK